MCTYPVTQLKNCKLKFAEGYYQIRPTAEYKLEFIEIRGRYYPMAESFTDELKSHAACLIRSATDSKTLPRTC